MNVVEIDTQVGRKLADPEILHRMEPWQRFLHDTIAPNLRACLCCQESRIPELIALLLRGFPAARAAVLVPDKKSAVLTLTCLNDRLPDRKVLFHRESFIMPQAGEALLLHHTIVPTVWQNAFDLIVVADAYRFSCKRESAILARCEKYRQVYLPVRALRGEKSKQDKAKKKEGSGLVSFLQDEDRHHRIIGILPTNHPQNSKQTERIVDIFGGPLATLGTCGLECKPGVKWVFHDASTLPSTLTPLEKKRQRIWRNVDRNRLIARVAEAYASNDHATLVAFGLPLTEPGREVGVLVEGEEHWSNLTSHMRDWRYLRPPENEPRTGCEGFHRSAFSLISANTLSRLPSDIIINATGDASPTELRAISTRQVLLIDFWERHPSELAPRRYDTYRQLGWNVSRPTFA